MTELYRPDVVKLYVQGSLDGQACDNVSYWYTGETPPTSATLTTMMSRYQVWMRDNLLVHLSNTFRLVGIKAQSMSGPDGIQGYLIGTIDDVGVQTGPALPNSVAACMSAQTGRGGRSAHGRQYWSGLVESQTNGNRLTPAMVTQLNTAGQALLTDMNAGPAPAEMVIYSRYSNKALRAEPAIYFVTTLSLRDDVVDSQRRRLPGRGR